MRPERTRWLLLAAGASLLALTVGFFGGWMAGGGMAETAAFPPVGGSSAEGGIRLSPAGERVASGLKCPCGCPDLLLACMCDNPHGATEVKRFIAEQLGAGKSESDVRVELINRYGTAIQGITR
jgi:hypothetical protein